MNRVAAFLLLLLVLAGTFIPCCPDDCGGETTVSECGSASDGDAKAVCSPFFACPGCAVSIEVPQAVLPVTPSATESPFYNTYLVKPSSEFHSTLFQPPRAC
ncbi:MAG: hypothetical protein EOO09_08690 [Chitinophagaceae bacterium]|nr:MAG: hypothetical protein EOO09_08690 [Chitinophagaceae bacterium]